MAERGHDLERRRFLALTGAGLAAPLAARAAEPQASFRWKMVTSWPKNLPGPGVTAERLARRIEAMSAGRLQIRVYGAGELVPALEVFDAVGAGVAEMGHTAAFFWQGKLRASVFFTTVPFGLTAEEHGAWIHHGGGQALWDELYSSSGVKPFMAGNTGMGMGGWFKRPIQDLGSLEGLKYRIPGLGGEIFKALGAVPVTIAPGEVYAALQQGVIDGAEFVGPWSDLAFGFHQVAPYYYWPGFHEPNGTGECLVNGEQLARLPADLQAVVENACAAENAYSLAETAWRNGQALETLVHEHGVTVLPFPREVLEAARKTAEAVLADFAGADPVTAEIHASYEAARRRAMGWSNISTRALLNARVGG